jgi:hypothetical protein
MVCEKERVGHDIPSGIPLKFFFIDQDTHQFDNRQCRMRLVFANKLAAVRYCIVLTSLS